jgi:phosphonatase-like hydrolase
VRAAAMILPKLIVFDMAGTTVQDGDGAVNRCLRETLENIGYPVTADEANTVMGLPKPLAISMLLEKRVANSETVRELTANAYPQFLDRMLAYYQNDAAVAPIAGAEATFQAFRRAGVIIALDTGFSRAIADVILTRFGWNTEASIVDASIASDEVERGRPHPDMIIALRERFGIIEAASVAKVGDTPSDLQQGTTAGCGWVIGVTAGSHTEAQLAPHPHTHLIPTIAELPALFGLS